jgi:HAD superfamily hydrolase (TIGR01509 family)
LIDLIVFDLDGVLVDTKVLHFESLNLALKQIDQKFCITKEEQHEIYEGLTTKTKLETLTNTKGLPRSMHSEIWKEKQRITGDFLGKIEIDLELYKTIEAIKAKGIKIAVATNSIKSTVIRCLTGLGIIDLIDLILSNEDVQNPKPNSEIYIKVMDYFNITPDKTLILEDSPVGITAAKNSGANFIEIGSRKDITLELLLNRIDDDGEYVSTDLNILIPMAGLGSRFYEKGFKLPKPLILVRDNVMIQAVVESINIRANYIYVVQKEHYEKYHLEEVLNSITPNCKIIQIDGVTEGAAITALAAQSLIDNKSPLLIANSDQIISWKPRLFFYRLNEAQYDGGILTFEDTNPKWSYAKVDDQHMVELVAEKEVISNLATVGIYYWKHGDDFVKYAKQMINNNIRTNNEFYICPVFNEAIKDNKKIWANSVANMWGIGTPEDLDKYTKGQ